MSTHPKGENISGIMPCAAAQSSPSGRYYQLPSKFKRTYHKVSVSALSYLASSKNGTFRNCHLNGTYHDIKFGVYAISGQIHLTQRHRRFDCHQVTFAQVEDGWHGEEVANLASQTYLIGWCFFHPKITLLRVIPTMTFQNSLLTPLLFKQVCLNMTKQASGQPEPNKQTCPNMSACRLSNMFVQT